MVAEGELVARLLEAPFELVVDLARQHHLPGGGLPRQGLELRHRRPDDGALALLPEGDRPEGDPAGGEGDERRLRIVARALQDLGRRGEGAERPLVAVEARQHVMAEDRLQLSAGAGDGRRHPRQLGAETVEGRPGSGVGPERPVAAQLDPHQERVLHLRMAEGGTALPRLGEALRQLGDVGLHVALLAEIGEQIVEGPPEPADLVAAAGRDLLIVVPLPRRLGRRQEPPHRGQSLPGESEGDQRGEKDGDDAGEEESGGDLAVVRRFLFERGQSDARTHRLAGGV